MQTRTRITLPAAALCLLTCLLTGESSAAWFHQWDVPAPATELNTEYHDKAPFLSFDGLTLYFSRDVSPGAHFSRIYEARRSTVSGPFETPTEISSLNHAGGHVSGPWVSPDNLRMYYYITGGPGKRLKVAQRNSTEESWRPGQDIAELNHLGDLTNPTLTQDERIMVFSGYDVRGGRGEGDLWLAERADREFPFADVTNLASLNTAAADVHPSIAPDGLTLYFTSNRNGTSQIFRARRESLAVPFGGVEHMAALDTSGGKSEFPSISPDGKVLYFGRWPDGKDMDIYVSYLRRACYVDALHGADRQDGRDDRTPFRTIQKAIETAEDGDVILVQPGVYREEIRLRGKAVTIQSAGDAAVIEAPEGFAVSFYMGEGADTVLRNFIIANSYIGIFCAHSAPTITNVTVTGSVYGAEAYGDNVARITNSILWGNTNSDVLGFDVTYSCVGRVTSGRSHFPVWGDGNFSEDPLFVDPENGDYHVRSERGRYWPQHDIWVLDDVTSPCLDAGDPAADFSAERKPNGGRLNVGAHGGTAYAALSESPLSLDINGDGTVDAADLEMYTELWQQQMQPPVRPPGRLR